MFIFLHEILLRTIFPYVHLSPPGSQLATWLGARDPRVVKTVFDKGNMQHVESRNSKRGTGIFKSNTI